MSTITQLLRSYAAIQAASLRDVTSGALLLAMAAGVFVLSLAFVFIAGFLGLSSVMPAWQAALVIAGAALATALVMRLVARRLIRRRRSVGTSYRGVAMPTQQAAAAKTSANLGVDPAVLLTIVAVAGLFLGRRLSK